MAELKPCPYCGSKMEVYPFIYKVVELPQPIKLFGRWSLIKMRYREIPVRYNVECSEYCDGFCDFGDVYFGDTAEEAIEAWNRRADNGLQSNDF